jgi:hypothetical protein
MKRKVKITEEAKFLWLRLRLSNEVFAFDPCVYRACEHLGSKGATPQVSC